MKKDGITMLELMNSYCKGCCGITVDKCGRDAKECAIRRVLNECKKPKKGGKK